MKNVNKEWFEILAEIEAIFTRVDHRVVAASTGESLGPGLTRSDVLLTFLACFILLPTESALGLDPSHPVNPLAAEDWFLTIATPIIHEIAELCSCCWLL